MVGDLIPGAIVSWQEYFGGRTKAQVIKVGDYYVTFKIISCSLSNRNQTLIKIPKTSNKMTSFRIEIPASELGKAIYGK